MTEFNREAIRAFFEEWTGAFEDYEHAAEEIEDLGNGVAYAVFVQRGRPSGGGGWLEFREHACSSARADSSSG